MKPETIDHLEEVSELCDMSPSEFIESCENDSVELMVALISAVNKKFVEKFPELELSSDQDGLFINYLEDQTVNDEAEEYLEYLEDKVFTKGSYKINIEILECNNS